MTSRLVTVLEHITPTQNGDDATLAALKTRLILDSLRAQFIVAPRRLREMCSFMLHEMTIGLRPTQDGVPASTLRMLPSYVYKRDAGNANGIYYALDLGGTNFRVIRMLVRGGRMVQSLSEKFTIPKSEMSGDADSLFGFIARSVRQFMVNKDVQGDNDVQNNQTKALPLGFTFSFPVKQTGISSGELISWTKGFTAKGVEGHDVVKLLQHAFQKQGVNMNVVALCNDTVGTLITRYFDDATTEMGVILGTGSNACYWEKARNITKDADIVAFAQRHDSADGHTSEMVINMEFGNFDSTHVSVLPRTQFDDAIDQASPNRGAQRFEKMISGMYLGEISRQVLLYLASMGVLPASFGSSDRLAKAYRFHSKDNGLISADRTPGLMDTRQLLEEHYGVRVEDERARYIVREVCTLVIHRAAQLSGMAIAATLLKTGRQDNATVAVDGSVFEKTPGFRAVMQRTIQGLVGRGGADVRLTLTRDGSGFGAAFIAALASQGA